MADERRRVSVVSPVYQEEEGIAEFHRRLSESIDAISDELWFEIIYVNDGSSDGSLEALQKIAADDDRVLVVDLSRNFGHQVALSAGVDHRAGRRRRRHRLRPPGPARSHPGDDPSVGGRLQGRLRRAGEPRR